MTARRANRCRPSREHALLLRAALLPGAPAREAFAAWRASADFERIDVGSQRLLPLVARNVRLEPDDPLGPRIKAVYRYAWLKNQVLAQRTATLLERLGDAGIRTMLLKGLALVPFYGDDLGIRPMDDVDVLVPVDRASEAIDVLLASGLRPSFATPPEQLKERYLHRVSGWGFEDGKGLEIDLHWHMLYASVTPGSDDAFWQAARPTRFRDRAAFAPHPSDLLLQVCAHGSYWNPIAPIRWVADAVVLLRHAGATLDWDRVVEQARRYRIRLPIADCLRYLREQFAAPVPEKALRDLGTWRATPLERIEYRAVTTAPPERTPLDRAVHDYGRYLRRTFAPGRRIGPAVPIEYLRQLWRLPHAWQVPVQAAFATLGRPARLRRVVAPLLRIGLPAPGPELRYRLGDDLLFADGGNAVLHESHGWSRPEATGTWTAAREARVQLALSAPASRALRLSLRAQGFVCDRHPRVTVDVLVNDGRLARWTFAQGEGDGPERTVEVPPALANRIDPLEVTLHVRNPMSPERVGYGNDGRLLGLFVERLRLAEA